jgi:glycosyltransferase involved in cell wall biosynthesis
MASRRDPERCPVSVVIPCWRCADVVGRAFASVVAQTLQPGEIILVDDASGDDTLDALHGLATRLPRGFVKVLSLPKNGGPGIARNAGWDAAQGDYVAFLDADDAWHSRKLEIQMEWMARDPSVDLCGHASRLRQVGEAEPVVEGVLKARTVSLFDVLFRNPVLTRTVILKREIPMRFEGRAILEDHLLWIELLAAGKECRVLDAPLAFCFRPEFSPGGYSGDLWRTERRELNALAMARRKGLISSGAVALAAGWSLTKYARRLAIRSLRDRTTRTAQ